ncbi:hypothetical protein ABZ319_11225 [Nocardia sp. NPDC005978]|uniref:hypothetical protein n=1 Tax=Nocardia sp. NPDC005978 TaxID=3156725 RepID=UPI0033A7E366
MVLWLLFGALVLQHTGIATFTPYLDVDRIPPVAEGLAVGAVWTATAALGAGALVHTAGVAWMQNRSGPVDPVSRSSGKRASSLLAGAVMGMAVTGAVCAYAWHSPAFCIVN